MYPRLFEASRFIRRFKRRKAKYIPHFEEEMRRMLWANEQIATLGIGCQALANVVRKATAILEKEKESWPRRPAPADTARDDDRTSGKKRKADELS
jgi:hypothetical protein